MLFILSTYKEAITLQLTGKNMAIDNFKDEIYSLKSLKLDFDALVEMYEQQDFDLIDCWLQGSISTLEDVRSKSAKKIEQRLTEEA